MKSSKQNSIPVEVYQVSEIVQAVVQDAPIGTNLALYQGLVLETNTRDKHKKAGLTKKGDV